MANRCECPAASFQAAATTSRAAAYNADGDYLSIIYRNMDMDHDMDERAQNPSSSSSQEQKKASESLIASTREGNSIKRLSEEPLITKSKKLRVILVDEETNIPILQSEAIWYTEGCKENHIRNDSINSNNSNLNTSTNSCNILMDLAKFLAKQIQKNSRIILKGLIKKYHVALVQENVVETCWEINPGFRKYYIRFHKKFIEGDDLSDSAKKLKYYLEKYLNKNQDLSTIKLQVSEKFGQCFQLDKNPQIKELDKLSKELVTNINLSLSLKNTISIHNNLSFKEDIHKLAGHVLKKEQGGCVAFTEDFLNLEKKLPGNINLLRELIINKLPTDFSDFRDLSKCQFKINNFVDEESADIEMELPKENFIQNDTKLTKTIHGTLNKMQHTNAKEVHHDSNNLRSDSNLKIKFTFIPEALETLTLCLTNVSNKQVNLINTDYAAFHIQKIQQIIKTSECILVYFNNFFDETYSIFKAFESCSKRVLLIEYSKSLENIESVAQICSKLENLAQNSSENNLKKIVVIGDTKCLHNFFKSECNIIDEKCIDILSQLTEESQLDLLQKIQINFYDRQIKFIELMNKHALVSIINTPQLLKQVLTEVFVIKNDQSQHQEYFYNTEFVQEILLVKNQTVIISGESGAGKSTYLQKLKDELIKSSVSSSLPAWIVSIHLNKTDVIKKLEGQTFKERGEAINFMIELLGYQGLKKKMFVACAAGQLNLQLVIFFYGFEERLLHPSSNTEKVEIKFLKVLQLASGITKIYFTCKPELRTKLERKLNAFTLELKPFTRQQILEFMVECLHCYKEDKIVNLSDRVENLLKNYESDKNLTNIINTPLKLKMLIHIHRTELMSNIPLFTHNIQSNLCQLYENFIDKCNLDFDTRLLLNHLSLRRLLTNSELKTLRLDEMQPLDEEQIFKNQNSLLRHLTIAEYFVARWLSENIEDKNNRSIIVHCIERLIVETSKVFFDTIIQYFEFYDPNKCITHTRSLVEQDLVNWFSAILQQGILKLEARQMLLRMAAKKNRLKIVTILLNYCRKSNSNIIEFIESKSPAKHGSKSALILAAEAGHVVVACELMLAGADSKGLKPKFLQPLLHFLLDEIFKNPKNSNYISLMEKFVLHETNVVIEILETDKEFKKLFTFFLDKGHTQVVTCLLKALHDWAVAKPQLFTLSLDIINNNKNINDEERLEMSSMLLNKLNGSLKEHVVSILKAAIKHNHLKSYEYFLDHFNHRQGSIEFFKYALLHNLSDVLKFILRNNGKLSEELSFINNTALNLAMSIPNINPRLIKLVIDQGNFGNENKLKAQNPLCTALKRNVDPNLVYYIAERHGNLLTAEDMHGMLPWCYILLREFCRYSVQNQLELIKYFLSKAKLKVPCNKSHASPVFDKRRQEIAKKLDFFQHINSYNINYTTMPRLHKAIQENDANWLAFLLDHGADIDVREPKFNKSALHLAAELGHYNMVELLLQHGATFDATDRNNKIPVYYASNREIRFLLQMISEYFYGKNLINMLTRELKDNITKHVVQSTSFRNFFTCRDRQGRTLLHVAADDNSRQAISKLMIFSSIYKNCYPDKPTLNINTRNNDGDTPLHIASRKGYLAVAMKLLSFGANFELKDAKGKTPYSLALNNCCEKNIDLYTNVVNVFDALRRSEFEIVENRIENGQFIINAKDRRGMTAFHWIVYRKANDFLKILVARKANIYFSAVDLEGRTALHIAAEVDNLTAAKLLLKLGLNLNLRDNKGRRAFECGDSNSKCVNMLLNIYNLFEDLHSHEPRILLDEHPEYLRKYLKKMEKLYQIEPFVVLNTKIGSDYWDSLTHQAALYNYRAVLENLLRHGGAVPRQCEELNTGEDTRSKKLVRKVQHILKVVKVEDWENSDLDNKLIAKCRTHHGDTLLHKAVQLQKSREISWLLDKGANPLDTNLNNISALSLAEEISNPKIINLLKKTKLDDKQNQ